MHAIAADGRLLPTIEASGIVLAVALLAWWHVLVQALWFVRPPQRWQPSPTLVATNDAPLLQRIHAMTVRLGLREPVVLERRASHGPAIATSGW